MALDKVVDSALLDGALTATADAIREKTGGSDLIPWDETKGFADAVSGIEAGGGGSIEEYIVYENFTGNVPQKVTYNQAIVPENFMSDKTKLAEAVLLDNVRTIGDEAFSYCTSLSSLVLPDGLERIGTSAFESCSVLQLTKLPSSLTSLGSAAFKGCSRLALTELPENLTNIQSSTFSGCSDLAISKIPNAITVIYGSAFRSCSSLKEIEWTDGASYIAQACLAYCSSLSKIDAKSISEIVQQAFYNCSSLNTVVLRRTSGIVKLSNTNAFYGTPFASGGTGGTVYVPSALIESYKTATNWSTLYAAGTCNFVAIEGSEYE